MERLSVNFRWQEVQAGACHCACLHGEAETPTRKHTCTLHRILCPARPAPCIPMHNLIQSFAVVYSRLQLAGWLAGTCLAVVRAG